jgi:hypothetical protein
LSLEAQTPERSTKGRGETGLLSSWWGGLEEIDWLEVGAVDLV